MTGQSINQFLQGQLINDYIYAGTLTLSGNPNRYWRANETGEYIQDKFQLKPNLNITAGLRFDWFVVLTAKNGISLNFNPSKIRLYQPSPHSTSTALSSPS